jgi:2-phosphoglycerate kinase
VSIVRLPLVCLYLVKPLRGALLPQEISDALWHRAQTGTMRPIPLGSISRAGLACSSMEEPFLLILTGPPGAGKTTVSRAIADRFNPSACIELDWFWPAITNGFILPWKAEADPQNQAVIRSFLAAAARMVIGGYTTVLEGIVGPWYLNLVREELRVVGIAAHYVVLRPDYDTCLSRALRRGRRERVSGHPPQTYEETTRLLLDLFDDLGDYERHAIDTTEMSEARTADSIVDLLQTHDSELSR